MDLSISLPSKRWRVLSLDLCRYVLAKAYVVDVHVLWLVPCGSCPPCKVPCPFIKIQRGSGKHFLWVWFRTLIVHDCPRPFPKRIGFLICISVLVRSGLDLLRFWDKHRPGRLPLNGPQGITYISLVYSSIHIQSKIRYIYLPIVILGLVWRVFLNSLLVDVLWACHFFTKSASTLDLMVVLLVRVIENGTILVAHFDILLVASFFPKTLVSGKVVGMVMEWTKK